MSLKVQNKKIKISTSNTSIFSGIKNSMMLPNASAASTIETLETLSLVSTYNILIKLFSKSYIPSKYISILFLLTFIIFLSPILLV